MDQAMAGSINGLATNSRQTVIWTNADPVCGRMYIVTRTEWVNAHKKSTKCELIIKLSGNYSQLFY